MTVTSSTVESRREGKMKPPLRLSGLLMTVFTVTAAGIGYRLVT
jgi:hypothetical protein